METVCDYCNKNISKKRIEILKNEHHFCNRYCYNEFRKENHELFIAKVPYNLSYQAKLRLLAERRKTIMKTKKYKYELPVLED